MMYSILASIPLPSSPPYAGFVFGAGLILFGIALVVYFSGKQRDEKGQGDERQ